MSKAHRVNYNISSSMKHVIMSNLSINTYITNSIKDVQGSPRELLLALISHDVSNLLIKLTFQTFDKYG